MCTAADCHGIITTSNDEMREMIMATFTVHQLDRDLPQNDIDTYYRLSFNSKRYQPEDFQFFNPVARCEAEDMEEVFDISNRLGFVTDPETRDELNQKLRRFMPMHSMSVGDIIECHTGMHEYYIVADFGFEPVAVA